MFYVLLMVVWLAVVVRASAWAEEHLFGDRHARPSMPAAEGDWLIQTDPARGWWWVSGAGDFMSRRSGWEGPLDTDPRLDGEVENLATLPAAVYRRFPTRAWRVKRA